MKPTKISVYDLFYRERRYVVPLYQRAYVWTQEDQWEPLWDDIEGQAEACLAAKADDYVPKRTHFLGAVVLNVERIVGGAVARSEVIDGQQRLTTLQLFLAALRDYSSTIKATDAAKIGRLTLHIDETPGSEAAFKVWPTNADREEFRTVMTAGSVAKVLNGKKAADLPRISNAYVYFARVIEDYVEQGGAANTETRESKINGLLQAMRVALHFVLIELEDGDDPQVIFETLNARGQPLLPSDLIRNYVFMQASNDRNVNSDDLYRTYWSEFDTRRAERIEGGESRFWHIPERQGRLLRPRIDLFIFHYLVLKTGKDLKIGELFSEFREWREAKPVSLVEFLSDLTTYSKIFAALILPEGHGRVARLARRLKSLDTSTVYPLLLYILAIPSEKLPMGEQDQVLTDLESWLVRRMICQLTPKNYNRFFVQLLNLCKQAPAPADLPSIVRAELSRSAELTLNWPGDQEFLRGWLTNPMYVRSRPDRSAMILRAIEERLRTRKNEAVILPDELTVEHLLPQQGKLTDYPYAALMPFEQEESQERCRQRVLNTIGNLTLLTQELNSAVSNGPIDTKAEQIGADSDLRLNAWVRGNPIKAWNENDIEDRGRDLMKYAVLEWPAPTEISTKPIQQSVPIGAASDAFASGAPAATKDAGDVPNGREGHNRGTSVVHYKCRVNGGEEVYNSVYKAFEALRLNLSKHQTFRAEVRNSEHGVGVYEEGGKSYLFELIDFLPKSIAGKPPQ